MTGPEHYREAERILTEGVSYDNQEHNTRCDAVFVAVAQVHATLALAAATVAAAVPTERGEGTGMILGAYNAWTAVIWPAKAQHPRNAAEATS